MNTLFTLLNQNHGESAHMGAPEAFVLLTLGFFAGMVGSVLLGAWILYRRANRPDAHRKLLMDMELGLDEDFDINADLPPEKPKSKSSRDAAKPWERDGDWWKSAE